MIPVTFIFKPNPDLDGENEYSGWIDPNTIIAYWQEQNDIISVLVSPTASLRIKGCIDDFSLILPKKSSQSLSESMEDMVIATKKEINKKEKVPDL